MSSAGPHAETSDAHPGARLSCEEGKSCQLLTGQGGIRTLETLLTFTRFPGVRLQPLGHLSRLMMSGQLIRAGKGRQRAYNFEAHSSDHDSFVAFVR